MAFNDFDLWIDKRKVRYEDAIPDFSNALLFSLNNSDSFSLRIGDDEVCRNLARMAASICDACRGVSTEGRPVKIGPGLLELLLKAAAHPSADISGIALEVLTEEISSETGLVHQLLPILQGRAITPHKFTNDDDGQMIIPSIQPQSGCDGFTGFDQFRNTTLTECLQACWQVQPKIYLSSCAAAIDEFCRSASIQVSFHLEAALFCMNAVAIEQALFLSSRSGSRSGGGDPTSDMMMMVSPYLGECMAALSTKPASLMSNPLTLAQACRFVDKVCTHICGNCYTLSFSIWLFTFWCTD